MDTNDDVSLPDDILEAAEAAKVHCFYPNQKNYMRRRIRSLLCGTERKVSNMLFRPNAKHWEIILDYLENNPELVTRRANAPNAKHILKSKWEVLANILNSLGYGSKSSDKWLKTWTDFKYNLKRKAADIKKDQSKTGGGSGSQKMLSDFEERALHLLGVGFIGLDIAEVGLPQTKKPRSEAEPLASNIDSYNLPTTRDILISNPPTGTDRKENNPNYSADFEHNYSNKRKRSKSKPTVEDAYVETIQILKEIHSTLDKHLPDISVT